MLPHFIPGKHPMHQVLDSIFLETRATVNEKTFNQAGFTILARGPRSFICVAEHKKLQGYLVKVFFDNELQKKFDRASWQWLVKRCEGAKNNEYIQKEVNSKTLWKRKVHFIEGNHGVFWENSQKFNRIVSDFLDDINQSERSVSHTSQKENGLKFLLGCAFVVTISYVASSVFKWWDMTPK